MTWRHFLGHRIATRLGIDRAELNVLGVIALLIMVFFLLRWTTHYGGL
ncbi:hypothetical protein [Pseudomonas duriflava]|nr:hypothetical protein [Pseudomonas duriflava]